MQSIVDILISLRDAFNGELLFAISMLLLGGWIFGWLAEKIKLPAVTGYLVAGLFLGESVTGLISFQMSAPLKTITDIALGIVAISIGSDFGVKKIQRLGKKIIIITAIQLLAAFLAVSIALYIFKMPLIYALLLGAIATATDATATVVLIQNLRARGEFVDVLYGVVALDDAGCVVIFAAVFAIVGNFFGNANVDITFGKMVSHAFFEIGLSIIIGALGGFLLHFLSIKKNNPKEILIIALGVIVLIVSVCSTLKVSSLLANMVAGTFLINLSDKHDRIFHYILPMTPPLYAAFFAIAGTEINLSVLSQGNFLVFGSVYILARALGKYFGVRLGANLSACDHKTRKYLGFAMVPQAGVAIGLVLYIQASPIIITATPEVRLIMDQLVNIVFFAVMVNELAGPPISDYAIKRGADL